MSIYDYHALKGLGLSDRRILVLRPRLTNSSLETGDVVFQKGELGHPLCLILHGLVSACLPLTNGDTAPVDIYGQGTWFGESTIFSQRPSALAYICLAPTRLLAIPHDDAQEAFCSEAPFSQYVANLVVWRSQRQSELLGILRNGNLALRVVLGLALFAESINNGASHLSPPVAGDELEIPLKQSLVASICGVSRSVFSELIQQLAAHGWLKVNYSTITVLKLSSWLSFSRSYRRSRQVDAKPSLPDLLAKMDRSAYLT